MAWTTPNTWTSALVTVAQFNTYIRDNFLAVFPGGASATAVTFSSGDYTANNSMTWTLTAGDQTTFRYIEIGKTMRVWLYLTATTVGGTPSSELRVTVPNGRTVAATVRGPFYGTDNGTDVSSFYEATASGTVIKFYRNASAGNWTASTNNTAIFAVVDIETT